MRTWYLSSLFIFSFSLGCVGPISYLSTVTVDAQRYVAEAKTAEAEQYAPYEYWSAVTYLKMARQKAGYADYQVALKYGELAIAHAKKARRKSDDVRRAGPSSPINNTHASGDDQEQPPTVVDDAK